MAKEKDHADQEAEQRKKDEVVGEVFAHVPFFPVFFLSAAFRAFLR